MRFAQSVRLGGRSQELSVESSKINDRVDWNSVRKQDVKLRIRFEEVKIKSIKIDGPLVYRSYGNVSNIANWLPDTSISSMRPSLVVPGPETSDHDKINPLPTGLGNNSKHVT